ncbi:MAG: 7TM diverse intracellular signaling domain-containing protein [Polaromonas sp.]
MRCPTLCHWPPLVSRLLLKVSLLFCLLLAWPGPASAQRSPSPTPPPVTPLNSERLLDLREASLALIDPQGTLTVEQAITAPGMAPSQADTTYRLGEKAALWLYYRFQQAPGHTGRWVMEFPLPVLDQVSVFQRDARGQWQRETAGDTVPLANWPEPGRYAQFGLQLPDHAPHDVLVRLQHVTTVNIPVNAVPERLQAQRLQLQSLTLGLVFGVLLFLAISCAVQSRVYRDPAYGWYAAYAFIMVLVLASWTGIGGQLLWPNAGLWNDLATGCLALISAGTWPMVVRHLCQLPSQRAWQRVLDRLLMLTGLAGIPLALAYLLLPRGLGVRMLGADLLLVSVLTLARALICWRRGDAVAAWVLAAFTPLTAATFLTVAHLLGWAPASWLAQYAMTFALSIQVPLLLVALHLRSRERHGIELRAQALYSQDALTGLLVRPIFDDRLHQTVLRAQHREETAAVVFIELANYAYVKKTWGIAVAEQSLLRSVIKLRRVLRDVNTVGRIDEARFGVILEGVSSRSVVTDLATRLIASGLMPLQGLKPEVVLQFHVSGALLSDTLAPGPVLAQALTDLLNGMSARTRRPIRFLRETPTVTADGSSSTAWSDTDSGPDTLGTHSTRAALSQTGSDHSPAALP